MSKSTIEHRPNMQFMLAVEPALRNVLQIAARKQNPRNRWQVYEALKAVSTYFVGRSARCPELRSSAYYEAFLDALDELLPVEADGSEEEEESDAMLELLP